MFNILVVEDDPSTRRYFEAVLKRNGWTPYLAADGHSALNILDTTQIDCVLTDIMMPGMDGYRFTEELRSFNQNMPILMISAKSEQRDKRQGFLVGTDDYMTKPIDDEEMVLRIKALLRRAKIVSEKKIILGSVELDYDSLSVKRADIVETLPQKEFYLLYKLLSYPDQIFTRAQLMDEIWGMDSDTDERTVDVHIKRLRDRYTGLQEFEILTVRSIGYKVVRYI
ncbi:MAG: response regulator transcription factor [Spirochaetaceae bacterium]|jgi:DNA-binding response OmpR family regulator|nr:response regulator transcription factor [Spirochaetaceae bacterium]